MRNVHLLVLIHGMWGNPEHLAELNRIITETKGKEPAGAVGDNKNCHLEVLVAQKNRDESTYDGFDWGGERIVEEIYEKKAELENAGDKLTRFSVAGYSLGGLIGRYVIGVLLNKKFFDDVEPVNFTTIATPHLGIPRYPSIFSAIKETLGPRLLSRSGEQFFAVDHWSAHGRPLLLVLADKNRIFYEALQRFPNVTFYANAINDMTVPYVTSGVDSSDPFAEHETNGIQVEFDPDYKPIIKSWTFGEPPPPKKPPIVFSQAWFQSKSPNKWLPPILQYSFPMNLIIFALIPIIIPAIFTIVVIRLSLSQRSSRARIKLLETEEQSSRSRLISIIAKLEKGMEDAVVDIMNDPGLKYNPSSVTSGASTPGTDSTSSQLAQIEDGKQISNTTSTQTVGKAKSKKSKQPFLTATQLLMHDSLNSLPQLKKYLAFIDNVRNAHSVIVSRDIKNFAFHRRGEGVIRHWADNFVV